MYASVLYKRQPQESQNFLKQTELYGNSTALTNTAALYANGRQICHGLRTGFWESEKLQPLPFIRSGIELEVELAPFADVVSSAAGSSSSYSVSNVRFVACMVQPTNEYLRSFQSTLESGNSEATIPLNITRSISFTPSTTTVQDSNLFVGAMKSLNSAIVVKRESNVIATSTAEYSNTNANGLSRYYWQIGSQRYPRNDYINCNVLATTGSVCVDNIMQTILPQSTGFGNLNMSDITNDTDNLIYYNWKTSPLPGSGVPVSDLITLRHEYSQGPAGTETMNCFLNYDANLKIGAASVSIDSKDL